MAFGHENAEYLPPRATLIVARPHGIAVREFLPPRATLIEARPHGIAVREFLWPKATLIVAWGKRSVAPGCQSRERTHAVGVPYLRHTVR